MRERRYRIGDRVLLRQDLAGDRRDAVEERGLPFDEAGHVREIAGGHIVLVVFASGRAGFVRGDDLMLLTPVEERIERKQEVHGRRRLEEQAQATNYFTPDTVDDAFRLGHQDGWLNRPHMARRSFLVTAVEHPFPQSLWMAYRRGHRVGTRARMAKQDMPAAGTIPPVPPTTSQEGEPS
jgi:hypothetical protein